MKHENQRKLTDIKKKKKPRFQVIPDALDIKAILKWIVLFFYIVENEVNVFFQ